jgi:hypothetical protein
MPRALLVLLLALVALSGPAGAVADDGGGGDHADDARVTASCTRSATAMLRVRERDDDLLRLDFELRDRRRAGPWLVVVVHERRLVVRARLRPSRSSGTLTLRRTVPDLFGQDTVRVRASGPGGASCQASATLDDA